MEQHLKYNISGIQELAEPLGSSQLRLKNTDLVEHMFHLLLNSPAPSIYFIKNTWHGHLQAFFPSLTPKRCFFLKERGGGAGGYYPLALQSGRPCYW